MAGHQPGDAGFVEGYVLGGDAVAAAGAQFHLKSHLGFAGIEPQGAILPILHTHLRVQVDGGNAIDQIDWINNRPVGLQHAIGQYKIIGRDARDPNDGRSGEKV